jgi:tRNA nucleotidyltransferase (CCA-adding enzyme)
VIDDEVLARLAAAVPANVREVCETLTRAGYEAVTVGGAVRDAILARVPGDWDVATSAEPAAVMKLFRHTIPTGLQHGTVTIVTGRGAESHVEATTYRGEGAYTDARRPDHVVFGVPLVEDLARRDLRVNAIAYDPAKRLLIDPYAGRADIRDRTLRAVGPTGNVYEDAVGRFTEDGLRVMRAVRFAAQLEFSLDPDTERGIVPALPSLAKVSKERVSAELRKILAAREPSRALAPAQRTGIIALIVPALEAGFDAWATTWPGRAGGVAQWLQRIDRAPGPARLGAMFAEVIDVPPAKRLDKVMVRRIGDILRALKFSNEEIAVAAVLAAAVDRGRIVEWSDVEIRRLLGDITRANASLAVALWRADGSDELADRAEAILARGDALHANELAVGGADLMTELALAPGPRLGKLLAGLLERVVAEPALNTREQLIALARELP